MSSLAISVQAELADENWASYMNSSVHSGFTTNTMPPNRDIAWSFDTGHMRLYAPPVVYDGVAYVLGQKFFALNAYSGRELWSYPIAALANFTATNTTKWHVWSEWASPTVYGDRVYITTSLDNEIVALDRTPEDGIDDGRADEAGPDYDVIWVHKVQSQNLFGSRSSPLVIDDVLYVGTAEGDLIALEADPLDSNGKSTGEPNLLWSYHVGTRIDSSPAYYDDMILIGTWDIRKRPPTYTFDPNDTYVTALDATPGDGKDEGIADPPGSDHDVIWRTRLGDLIWGSPTIDGSTGMVYIGSTDWRMYAIEASSGIIKWNFTADSPVYSAPALADNKLFFGTTDPGNSLYAIDATDGTLVWRFQADEKVGASPIVVDGLVLSPVMSGRINALHIDGNNDGTTTLLWTIELPSSVRAAPALAHGRLYFSCWDSKLYSIGKYPGVDLVVSGFGVKGDSREVTIEFALINLGDGEIINSTVFINDGLELIYSETLGPFPPGAKYFIWHTITDPEPRNHLYKIRLNYTDGDGSDRRFYFNTTQEIEKYTIPSFIPAPGTGLILISFAAVFIILNSFKSRRKFRHE